MKRIVCLLLAMLAALSLTACGRGEEPEKQELFAMDTYMSLIAYGDGARDALAAAAREINRLERELSRTVSTSDVYQLNAGGSASVSDETAALLTAAVEYSEKTGGLFDVTIAPLVTLWGITTDSPRVPSQGEIDALLPLVGSDHIHLDGDTVPGHRLRRGPGGHCQGLCQRPGGGNSPAERCHRCRCVPGR